MAGWKANLSLLQLDPRLQENVDKQMLDLTKEAARVWLDAALAIVPTWSRASRATFEALAQAVGYTVTYGPIRSFTDRRPLGLRTGFGGLTREAKASYSFYYRSDLEYLNYNESNVARVGVAGVFKGLINPTPYNFREAGEKAFRKFAQDKLGLVLRNVRITSGKAV
jgi:hypothetical protein